MNQLLLSLALRPLAELGQTLPTNWPGVIGVTLVVGLQAWIIIRQTSTRRKVEDVKGGVDTANTNITAVNGQVTNGGTNLAATVGEVKQQQTETNRMLAVLADNQRIIHDEHLGAINRNISILNQGVAELRGGLQALERKFEGRECAGDDIHIRGRTEE